MKKNFIYFGMQFSIIFLLSLILFSCVEKSEILPKQEIVPSSPILKEINNTQQIENDTVLIEKPISCDDGNSCTKDIFDYLTKTCKSEVIIPCCGNNKCEVNEGCNFNTMVTSCVSDCGRKCPAQVEIVGLSCSGDCDLQGEEFTVRGDSKINIDLENKGELIALFNVDSQCDNASQTHFFSYNQQPDFFIGLAENYIDVGLYPSHLGENQKSFILSVVNKPYFEDRVHCTLRFRGDNGIYLSKEFYINVKK
ncbi:hypothetical protein J4216_03845 [Candidatus Woesearchaeota archaeon]|nr:hypothetical protein [Candidatus Woesearchaeota archaeon]